MVVGKSKIRKLRKLKFQMQPMPEISSMQFAKEKRSQMLEYHKLLLNQHMDMAKWLLASLLTLNSGGFIALLSNSKQIGNHSIIGILYCSGALFALLNGWLIQIAATIDGPWLRDAHDYWLIVETTGHRTWRSEYIIHKNAIRAVSNKRLIPATGWMSAIFFLIASVVMALSMKLV